ncbi:tetratricopeptide (TPR) repeat protein [Deinococcus metalli]|uniref:Tetratricopeptide (TPR) repeat protein n=1 Tax=Deinococcus metalli TaxID=1141878 RepID=A0A7W8KJM5_9DEIO|nr:tetratricopeptide repeat protein [Deinococcus metalli]MBB5378181.1 tetratricopeptide (TPR) repeat protein [Deinococcus metalli]GHF56640.1 hypothetical protein GCM10017781_36200 [Deinococcus metalli]
MLQAVWTAIDDQDYAQAEATLRADRELLVSRAGMMALGSVYALTGRHDDAREVFTTLRDAHRGDPWEHIAVHQLARTERLAGNPEAALALLDEELALLGTGAGREHERAVGALERAMSLRTLGRLDDARAVLDECETLAGPDDPETLGRAERERAEVSVHAGHPQAARVHFERAIALLQSAEDDAGVRMVQARLAALDG